VQPLQLQAQLVQQVHVVQRALAFLFLVHTQLLLRYKQRTQQVNLVMVIL
jgi:hypothetical protein